MSLSLNDLQGRKLIIFTGKGGIGKSLVTAALGQLSAENGIRTLLIERAEQEQIAPIFGVDAVGHREVKLQENLNCINLDPTKCFEEYIVKQLGQKKLFEKVFSNNVVRTFLNTIPGLSESMLLGRIFYTCELIDPSPYDLVLFDAPASGHMQNLMTTLDAIINSGLGGPIVRELVRVRSFLADTAKVGAVVVATPEDLVISEILEFLPKLEAESPAKPLGVLVNRCISQEEFSALQGFSSTEGGSNNQGALSFLLKRYEKNLKNQKRIVEELEHLGDLGHSGRYAFLPELGSIEEPLEPGFGQFFLKDLLD
ncbi:MAG: ArsA-related P-loop ATPase [Bdellovibrionota bacterium]